MPVAAHIDQPGWTINVMKPEQTLMVASWISALALERSIDADEVGDQMLAEWTLAQRTGFVEFYIGSLDDQPVFFLNGYQSPDGDYHLLLLTNTMLPGSHDFQLSLCYQVLRFLFDRKNIHRVVVELDLLDLPMLDVMMQSGFRPANIPGVLRSGFLSYVCERTLFIELP